MEKVGSNMLLELEVVWSYPFSLYFFIVLFLFFLLT